MTSAWRQHKQDVADTARRMADLGLVVGTAGNVSSRVERDAAEDLMAVTPTGVPYSGMTAADIVITDFDVDPVEGDLPPSSESLLHVGIYRARPDVHAVIHTHSVYSSVLAVLGIDLPSVIDEVVVYVGGEVRVSDYAFPGTEDLSPTSAPLSAPERPPSSPTTEPSPLVGPSTRPSTSACSWSVRPRYT